MRRTIRHNNSSLGMPMGTPRTYSRRFDHLRLVMPEASLLIHQQISGRLVHDLYYSYCAYMIITMMNVIFSVHLLLTRIFIVFIMCLKFMVVMIVLLPLLLMTRILLTWRVLIITVCMWIIVRIFIVTAILLNLVMMLLKVVMREENWF